MKNLIPILFICIIVISCHNNKAFYATIYQNEKNEYLMLRYNGTYEQNLSSRDIIIYGKYKTVRSRIYLQPQFEYSKDSIKNLDSTSIYKNQIPQLYSRKKSKIKDKTNYPTRLPKAMKWTETYKLTNAYKSFFE